MIDFIVAFCLGLAVISGIVLFVIGVWYFDHLTENYGKDDDYVEEN